MFIQTSSAHALYDPKILKYTSQAYLLTLATIRFRTEQMALARASSPFNPWEPHSQNADWIESRFPLADPN